MGLARPDLIREGDAQFFVIRVRPLAGTGGAPHTPTLLRIEHVNAGQVWNFTDVGAAIGQLKTSLDEIVVGSAA
ncbi:MAG: hypothetical protein WBA73_02795 [Devosia sp.]